jgi:large subunit ribosomal protein L30
MPAADAKKIKITLVKSGIARPGKHKAILIGLGLKKLNKSVIRQDTPEIRAWSTRSAILCR